MRKPIRIALAFVVLLLLAAAALVISVRMLLGGDRIRSAIEAQASAALGRPVSIRTAVPRRYPRVSLELTGVTIGAAQEVTIDFIRLSTGLRALIGRRVEDAEISVERSRIDVRWALALIGGLAGRPDVSTASAASPYALAIESVGAIAFRDVTLAAGPHTLLVEMDSALAGDRFEISRLQGKSGHSVFRAEGEIGSLEKRTGTFTVDADTLDLDGLMAFLVAATPSGGEQIPTPTGATGAAGGSSAPFDIEIALAAKQGRTFGVALSNLSAHCRLKGENVTLDDLKSELFGGRFDGRAAYVGSGLPRYEWQGTLENLDVQQVVDFAGASGSITGRLGAVMNLVASGTEPIEAMRRAKGTARVTMTDGRIPGLEIVRAVVLAFGKPTGARPEGSGEAFTRVAATLAINGQNASTDDLTFNSRDFDMTGEGTLSFAAQAVNFRTDVILSREVSAQAGRDLYRLAREGDRIVLPARITGTVSSPVVVIDIQSALQRALRNRVEDEVKGLFDRFRKKVIK
jgi:uncharacterized protein involved in outer membrane biogenesis